MEKIIHLIWTGGFDSAPAALCDNPAKWGALNPGYRIRLWNGSEILRFVEREYPMLLGVFRAIDENSTEKVAAVKTSDLARLLILHHYGGTYADLDTFPLLPLSSLFGEPFGSRRIVRHRFTPFIYARGNTQPTVLDTEDERTELVNFSKYDLIFSREHQLNAELGGCLVSNAVIHARAGSKLLADIIGRLIPNWKEPVLRFAGPFGISQALRALMATPSNKGKVYSLPPFYTLWQADMGQPWPHTICLHSNEMAWVDRTLPVPWLV